MVSAVDEDLALNLEDGVWASNGAGMVRFVSRALRAAGFPVKPPAAWFTNPGFRTLTPLTVDDDGHVYGHIASWKTSHVGMQGGIKAPKSRSNYAFFATGVLDTAEGEKVNVGQITLTGGHAALDSALPDVVAHYDNTQSAVMDVAIGEDKHGIWVSGALRPDIDDLKLRTIRASSVSGDWRPINGNLELVAVCAVNVPGFPIPRVRVASGTTLAMVAAGTEPLVEMALHDDAGPEDDSDDEIEGAPVTGKVHVVEADLVVGLLSLDERITRLEQARATETVARRAVLDEQIENAIAASMVNTHTMELRSRVRPTTAAVPPEDVWEDGEDIAASIRGLLATATKQWTTKKRGEAAKKGQSLSDGSFPIADCRDVEKAVRAMGRSKHSADTVKKHIRKRAKALGCTSNLPESWK